MVYCPSDWAAMGVNWRSKTNNFSLGLKPLKLLAPRWERCHLLLLRYALEPGSFNSGDKNGHIFSLATVCAQYAPWSICSGELSWSTQPTLRDPCRPSRDKRLHSGSRLPQILEEAKYLCSFEIRCSEEILTCSALCEETQGSSADTGFKATSEFPHLYGTDGSGSGSRVLTAPLKML